MIGQVNKIDKLNEIDENTKTSCCFNCFYKSEKTFDHGISNTAYIGYIPYEPPQIKNTACIPDYSNPMAEYYLNEIAIQNRKYKFCSIISNFYKYIF